MESISQKQFEELLDELEVTKKNLSTGEKFQLAQYLIDHNFSLTLDGINFAIPGRTFTEVISKNEDETIVSATQVPRRTALLQNIDFSGCEIANCKFDKCDLSGSVFKDQTITGSSFNQTILNNISITNTNFDESTQKSPCIFSNASFDYSSLDNVTFNKCTILQSTFNYLKTNNDILFENCELNSTAMIGGKPSSNVLIKSAEKSQLNNFFTSEFIQYENVQLDQNKPSILLSWNNKAPGMFATLTEKMLMARDFTPLRMDYNPQINEEALDQEINILVKLTKEKMKEIRSSILLEATKIVSKKTISESNQTDDNIADKFAELWKNQGISFPMLMIQIMRENNEENPNNFPQMAAIYRHAKEMYDIVDGVMIPGGQDIDPRFYGKKRHDKTDLPLYSQNNAKLTDARRDAIEFCLVYMQQRTGAPKPLGAICRGSQLIAVSYGGSLYQDLNAKERHNFHVECVVPKQATEETPKASFIKRIKFAESQFNYRTTLNAMFFHHQGYDLKDAHGLEAVASTTTSSNIKIDIVAENLPQNIVITQAHFESAFDKDSGSQSKQGFSQFVSSDLAESVFGQFDLRVQAYVNSKNLVNESRSSIQNQQPNEDETINSSVCL